MILNMVMENNISLKLASYLKDSFIEGRESKAS